MRISDWSSDVCSSDLVLLTRRVGADRSAPRTVHLVRSDRDRRWIEQLVVADDGALAELDLSVLGSDTAPGVGEPGPEHLHLVCTNGRHDPCCADFGRPVVRALRAAGVEVMESSHVGGDRFAANIVRSEEHTSELQSLMRISYAVLGLKQQNY